LKLRNLMTTNVRTCRVDSSVAEAARIMTDLNVGFVPVVDSHEHVTGVITDRDIVLRCVAHGHGADGRISTYMSEPVVTCTPETDAHEAAELMARSQIRRLCVVEGRRLVGVVALGDLAVQKIHVNEAGDALSSISEPARPGAH